MGLVEILNNFIKMGCYYSRFERKEMISRCKARKRYMKQFVKARNAFSASHCMYLTSLRNTGAALLQFAAGEPPLHHHKSPAVISPSNPPPPPPPPPMSSASETWTTSTGNTSSTPLPPPPPPPPPSSTWDFWDPFMPVLERVETVGRDEWEVVTNTTAASETVVTTTVGAGSVAAPPSVVSGFSKVTCSDNPPREMPVVISGKSKDLMEIIKELDEYFLRAADSGGKLSALLEVPACIISDQTSSGKINGNVKGLNPFFCSWSTSQRFNGLMKFDCNGMGAVESLAISGSHCSTVVRLYEWEKKLYEEVKNAESLKIEHEKKTEQLRKMELKRGDYFKIEKAKKEVEKLESRIAVSAQAIETTSQEIIKLRESQLYPQLVELVKGLMCMWRSLYESHQVQMHIVQQLKYINNADLSTDPTSEIHRQSTLQLELEVQQWHLSFCNLIKSQRDYIQSLTGWLRLSLFQFSKNPSTQTKQDSAIYTLCEEWQLVVDNAPDKVASEGIKALLTVVHAIVVQQGDEQKQKRRLDSCSKELEKKTMELRSLESKYGPGVYTGPLSGTTGRAADKRAKLEALKVKAEEEKGKYEKSVGITRATTLNNLQMGLPHVFQAVTGFANVWTHAFESVCNQANVLEEVHMM